VLLVGRHPLAPEGKSAAELSRATLEHDPPRPSQSVGDPHSGRVLRGDLDNIVAKALKKHPQERYQSAELMAQDLRHYLAHEPVSARADSLAYRAGKFVRRHRGSVVAGATVTIVLIAAAAFSTVQMFEARRQRDAALFQSKRAEFQARFAYQIMSEVGADGRPITIRELMQKGIEVLEKNYGDDPRFVISALVNISGRYMDLDDTNGEYAALLKAEALARKLGDPAEIASVQCNTVETEIAAGRTEKAAERLRDGLANLAKLSSVKLNNRIECGYAQVKLLWAQDKLDEGVVAARDIAHLMERNGLQNDIKYNSVVSALEIMLADSGHVRDALDWNRRITEALAHSGRDETMSMSGARHNQASYLLSMGDVRAAYQIEKAVVDEIVAQQGVASVPIATALLLGVTQVRIEETDAGLVWIDRAAANAEAGGFRAGQIAALTYRARAELLLGRLEDVPAKLEQAERMANDDPQAYAKALLAVHQIRAQWLLGRNDAAAALAEIDVLLAALDYPQKRGSDRLAAALITRATAQSMLGRHSEALAIAREALAVAKSQELKPDQSVDVGAALMAMAEAQAAQSDMPGARASAARAEKAFTWSLGPAHSETRRAAAFSRP
jgi:eukaryotic-like serine/threonine-protein kinase